MSFESFSASSLLFLCAVGCVPLPSATISTDGGTVGFQVDGDCSDGACFFRRIQVAGPFSDADCTGRAGDLVKYKPKQIQVVDRFDPIVWDLHTITNEDLMPSPLTYGALPEEGEALVEPQPLESGACYGVVVLVENAGRTISDSLYFDAP